MRRLVVLSGGLVAAGTAALIGAGVAISQPAQESPYNVTGEQYGRALAILKSQGIKAYFGGSTGSVLSQSACLVDKQKMTSAGRMLLTLDCTRFSRTAALETLPSAATCRKISKAERSRSAMISDFKISHIQ